MISHENLRKTYINLHPINKQSRTTFS